MTPPRRLRSLAGLLAALPVALSVPLSAQDGTSARVPSPRVQVAGTDLRPRAASSALETYIVGEMAARNIPGLQAAIVKDGQLWWSAAFGLADPQQGVPVDITTLFNLASVSKTVTATSLLQLVDQGVLDLDEPIGDHLPFAVDHPNHPTVPITARMLLTHTASLRDNWSVMPATPGDSPYPLAQYMEDYLTPGAALYSPALNFFFDAPPGTIYRYCNNGFALAGYLVEAINGGPCPPTGSTTAGCFDEWSHANTLAPLEMGASNWRLANLDLADVAVPCWWNGTTWVAYPHPGWREYPSTTLRSSANQLAQLLMMVMQDGEYRGQPFLTPASGQALTTPQVPAISPTQGLAFYSWIKGGRVLWGHNGADYGARTELGFDPSTGIGYVLLTNGESFYGNIVEALLDHAESAPPAAKLDVDVATISLATGGQQTLTLTGGATRAGWHYRILGGVTGTVPGLDFGGGVVLPLNYDAYFRLTLKPGIGAFGGFVGQLDASGSATATFTVPAGLSPTLAGVTLEHAYLAGPTIGAIADASNPTSVRFTP